MPKPKHPFSVMVWGGISKRGATKIIIFNGIMKAGFYQEQILGEGLKPFIESKYSDGHRFMQDNDPKHCANSTKQYMRENNINWWPNPPESPDLNPIEKLWNELKNNVEMATTKDELIANIKNFWGALTPARCTRYINHLHSVIPKVIENNGASTYSRE